jgi:hypothetical protein
MTPNIGQGANTAAEDAAVLASLIRRLAAPDSAATGLTVDAVLREYASQRYRRVKSTYQRSYFGARLHTTCSSHLLAATSFLAPSSWCLRGHPRPLQVLPWWISCPRRKDRAWDGATMLGVQRLAHQSPLAGDSSAGSSLVAVFYCLFEPICHAEYFVWLECQSDKVG